MERLPFDPTRLQRGPNGRPDAGPDQPAAEPSNPGDLTVTQLTNLIKDTLERRLPATIRVVGQVSNLSNRNHWYFSLKDEESVMGCVAWASSARRFGFVPADGDEVVATGHVSFYGPQGRTQLYVSKLEPVGAGALEIAFRKLCEELRQLGYFDPTTKLQLPAFPKRIAVITSKSSAAAADVKATALQRCPAVGLLIVDARVQGAGSAEEIAHAIRWVDKNHASLGVDAILVTRGGGSMEDLWSFNERIVADAAHNCSIPLVAAIGHESDTTVIELVADLRAATPTQAVMQLVPHRDELAAQIRHLDERLALSMRRRLEAAGRHIDMLARHEVFREPRRIVDFAAARIDSFSERINARLQSFISAEQHRIENMAVRLAAQPVEHQLQQRRQRIDSLNDRISAAMTRRVEARQADVRAWKRQLDAVDPRQVLKRGYSLTRRPDGSLIRSVNDINTGDAIVTVVTDGDLTSTVTRSTSGPGQTQETRKKTAATDRDDPASQLDLFSEGG